ncbi:STE3-domain-containing protein [Epithele typhae]|uniref:STE3-domain-containing protein n=1 Tax=Epithele typhae TaxID=378194 RepID=UPI0020080009|nr:STE3-domain-containing protein [Epithele typhae]KAH9916389.1 STE3-domain-containing protein [Epithele typhae]
MISTDPTWPAFPIVSFIGFVIVLIPMPWHLQAWNSGTCYYMAWTALGCLNAFVNSIVWADNAINVAPIWCDISTRITIGQSVGIPLASLCITRRLYNISRVSNVLTTRAEKWRVIIVDTILCVLLPMICMVFAYIVQGHRFNVFENLGCYPAIYNTLPAYFLVYMWPVVIGLVSSVYCVLSLISLFKRHKQFREFVQSGSALTVNRYYRLMALACIEILFTTPLGIYELYSNGASGALQPWLGWDDTHFNFSLVLEVPAIIWRSNKSLLIPLELGRWVLPLCAFTFFAFFGFAEEARRHYRMVLRFFSARFASLRLFVFKARFPVARSAITKHDLPVHRLPSEDVLPPYVAYPKPPLPTHSYDILNKPSKLAFTDFPHDKSAFALTLSSTPGTPLSPCSSCTLVTAFSDRASFTTLPSAPNSPYSP